MTAMATGTQQAAIPATAGQSVGMTIGSAVDSPIDCWSRPVWSLDNRSVPVHFDDATLNYPIHLPKR